MDADDSYTLLFEQNGCKVSWRRIDQGKLEFLLIKGDRQKLCVIDISNEYKVQQLTSLLDLIKREGEKRIPILILPENVDIVDGDDLLIEEAFEEVYPEEFEPIALPWHDSIDKAKAHKERMTLKRQYRETFGEDPDFTCPKCFKHFKQKGNMMRHDKTVHNPGKTKFECEICGKHYKHPQHFDDHVKSHEGYMHQCKACLEGFSSRNMLRAHKKSCGKPIEIPPKKTADHAPRPPFPPSTASAAQIPITLYSFGTPATASYAHILSTDPSVNTSTVALGITLRTEYDLAGTTVANYTADCPLSCFYSLTTKYAYNATMATASMARPNDQYPGLNDSPLKTVLCANAENACGATVPIYVYYNSQYLDYYVSTDGGGPTSGAASYGAATVPPNIIPGKALCWIWSPMTTTTVSTTTNTASTTTNTASTTTGTTNTGTTTPFTGSTTPYTGSTTTPYTGTTTPFTGSTTPPVTTTPYTGTTTRYTGTTTPYTGTTPPGGTTQKGGAGATPAGGENGDSTSSSSSSSSSSSWWKIPVIAIGVLLLLGVVIGLLGLLTVSFINPAPPKKAVVPHSPNAPNGPHVLPPQPVNAAPAPQPLTVGPSMGYTPAF